MTDCVFCQIIRGEIPCTRIYEDDRVLSFLDIGPINPGHALVIPKNHYHTLLEISQEDLCACVSVAQKVAKAIFDVTGAAGLNLLQNNLRPAGQHVDHIHFHLIPRRIGDRFFSNWPAKPYPPGEIEKMAEKVKERL